MPAALLAFAVLSSGEGGQERTWTLALGGDVMLNGVAPKSRPLAEVAPILRKADLSIVNLEIPITAAKTATRRKSPAELRAKTQFILKADPAHIGSLFGCGIDAVSLGNNHAMDFGVAGLKEMSGLLKSKGIVWSGAGANLAEARRSAHLERRNTPSIKFLSLLAFQSAKGAAHCTPATLDKPGVAWLGIGAVNDRARAKIQEIVEQEKADGSMLIVALHWGVERQSLPNSFQVALGRAFVDAGADLVVGHHPHVLQGAEIYKGKPILYSLGNLVSPRPAVTGVFTLAFEGASLRSIEVTPCSIQGGRTRVLGKVKVKGALEAWKGLCRRIAKAYPSKKSALPVLGVAATPALRLPEP
ncbi:MAG: CapA family protein [Armatimonadetes bacterium]|nr:CapA family protein [Armatimonadota bacterium]